MSAASARVLDPPEALDPEAVAGASEAGETYSAGEPVQVRVSVGAAKWLKARSETTGRSRSELVRRALHRLDRHSDVYMARPALMARRPWSLSAAPSTRASVRLTLAEIRSAEELSERFCGERGVSAALRLAVFVAAAEAAAAADRV